MTNQLVELTKETAMTAFTGDKGLDGYVQQVKNEVNEFEHDLTTASGRAKTISLASKVAKIKVKYDNCGKDLVAEWKTNASKVDKARKKMRDELDELKILARKPVTDWEEEQVKIEAAKQLKLEAEILAKEKVNDEEVAILMDEKFDRDLAELVAKQLAALQAEEALRKQEKIDNDARIAKEAAEQATAQAERLAQQAIDDAQAEKQKAINDKIKADNELLAAQAREKLLKEQAAQAETNRLADIETARQNEINRQNDEIEAQRVAQVKLEANTKHVSKIRGEIKNHLISTCGLDNALATKVVKALLHIDQVTINY